MQGGEKLQLFKQTHGRNCGYGKLVIGITGVYPGAGATHLGLMLASCISEGLGMKTAYLHWQENGDMDSLREYFFGKKENVSSRASFTVSDVTFYPCPKPDGTAEIHGMGYGCIIMDFGSDYREPRDEFLRCDKKVAVGSLTPWKRCRMEEFIREADGVAGSREWIYAVNHARNREAAAAARQFGRRFAVIPGEKDPFYLSPDAMAFTRNLL